MAAVRDAIDDDLAEWLAAQPMFFVATAPLAQDMLINLSPKGLDGTFAVIDGHTVAYLDLTGSGTETIAHLRENGRIVVMFCAFDGKPNIVRLHGRGRVLTAADAQFAELLPRFTPHPGIRSIIVVDLVRISDSCGYGVPTMEYVADRRALDADALKRGEAGLAEYRAEKNAVSIDGLPGF